MLRTVTIPGKILITMTAGYGYGDVQGSDMPTLYYRSRQAGQWLSSVWAGIRRTERTDLGVVNGKMNWKRYLNDIVIPVVQPNNQSVGNGAVFQGDNTRPTPLELSNITLGNMGFREWAGLQIA